MLMVALRPLSDSGAGIRRLDSDCAKLAANLVRAPLRVFGDEAPTTHRRSTT